MGVFLAKLEIQQGLSIETSVSGGETSGQTLLSVPGLRMELYLTPDSVPEAQGLGRVFLTIESKTPHLPEMTPEQTLTWVRERLKAML